MSTEEIIACHWCGESVSKRMFARHLKNRCPQFPTLRDGERVCTHCYTVKPASDFPNSRGGKHWCKACGLKKFREWKRKIRSGEITAAAIARVRPGSWKLNPCKYCGEMFNFQQGLYHKSRCPKRPPTAKSLITDYPDATIIPNMAAIREKYIATGADRRQRSSNLSYNYGITVDEYDAMLAARDGKCEICSQTDSGQNRGRDWLHVDHDHATGKIRGLLCTRCNHLLGNCLDSVALLLKAINYLLKHGHVGVVS